MYGSIVFIAYSKPFEMRVVTDTKEDEDEEANKGFKIKFMQIPC